MAEKKQVVLPSKADPDRVADYKNKIAAAKKKESPKSGVPMPDVPHMGDLEQAQKEGRPLAPGAKPFDPEEYTRMVQQGNAVHGIGGAYPANQELAGFKTREQAENHQEALRGLEALAEAQRNRPAATEEPEESTESEKVDEEEDKENVDDILNDMGPDQMSSLMVQIQQRKKDMARRKSIENRCSEMDLEAILLAQDARQTIKVVPKKFVLELRALNGEEDSYVKDRVWDEVPHNASDLYYQTRVALTTVAIGLTKLNGKELLDTRDAEGKPDEDKVAKKLAMLTKYPMFVLADIITNFGWFEERCRALLDYDSVKNG